MRLGSRSDAGSHGMERGSSACHFPGQAAAAPEDSRSLLDQGPINVHGLGSQRLILGATIPCPQLCPSGRPLPSWRLLGPNTNRNPNPNRDTPPKPKPASILTLHLSRLVPSTLNSALEGNHETGVASALATSLNRILNLSKAFSPRGPNSSI